MNAPRFLFYASEGVLFRKQVHKGTPEVWDARAKAWVTYRDLPDFYHTAQLIFDEHAKRMIGPDDAEHLYDEPIKGHLGPEGGRAR